VGQSPAVKNVNTEAEDIVGSVTRQRLVKTQETEDFVRAVVNRRVGDLALALVICNYVL
jgi:hypothetical protein